MDEKQKIEKILELTEDTNKTVHKIRRVQVLSGVWKTFYWIVVIGVGVGAFYFMQKYVDNVKTFFGFTVEERTEENPSFIQNLVN